MARSSLVPPAPLRRVLWAVALAAAILAPAAAADASPANGRSMGYLPKSIPWRTLKEVRDAGFLAANERPIMYLVSREGCPACMKLKSSVNAGGDHTESIKELADEFVMVAVSETEMDADDEIKKALNPNGKHGYVPRVLFASGDNVMAKKVTNRNTRGAADPKIGNDFRYFYPDAESLVVGMTTANTHFEDVKIKGTKKANKAKRIEEERKNPTKKKQTKHKKGEGGMQGLEGLMEGIKAQAKAQGANIDL
uniref:Thioredoxin domain-containing protein n=1 Tax=Mantoniella antarctica TaxID=81844 RepID=A0A7S0X7T8_9CHLO